MIGTNNNDPLISVIVPVYKVEKYINKCISSIINQTYQNIEIILVDDGSPDQCGRICDEWAEKDDRIRVIHQENKGLSAARNKGIEAAGGEYLAFVDSDDYIEVEMLEQLYYEAQKASALLAICNYIYEFENDLKSREHCSDQSYQISEDCVLSGQQLMEYMNDGKFAFGVVSWNKLYKRELFHTVRFPVRKKHEDEYVFHLIISQCDRIACSAYVGYHYLQRGNSITSDGGNVCDVVEARWKRCQFFLEQEDGKNAVLSEKQLFGAYKRAKEVGAIKKGDLLLKKYVQMLWKFYKKRWISIKTVCKRIIRFYIL